MPIKETSGCSQCHKREQWLSPLDQFQPPRREVHGRNSNTFFLPLTLSFASQRERWSFNVWRKGGTHLVFFVNSLGTRDFWLQTFIYGLFGRNLIIHGDFYQSMHFQAKFIAFQMFIQLPANSQNKILIPPRKLTIFIHSTRRLCR